MSQKYQDRVRAPERAMKEVTKKIIKTKTATKKEKALKVTGATLAGMTTFLLWLTRTALLDNALLRAGEKQLEKMKVGTNKKGRPKAFSSWIKKHPNLSAHLIYFGLAGAAIGAASHRGGTNGSEQQGASDATLSETEQVAPITVGEPIVSDQEPTYSFGAADKSIRSADKKLTFDEFKESLAPLKDAIMGMLILEEGAKLDAKGLHKPYRDGKGIATIGYGCTAYPDGKKVTMNDKHITDADARRMLMRHLERETFLTMYAYYVMRDGAGIDTPQEAIGLASLVYNGDVLIYEDKNDTACKTRCTKLRKMRDEGVKITPEKVRELFAESPINDVAHHAFGRAWMAGTPIDKMAYMTGNYMKDGGGIYWRRWLEAMVLSGKVTPKMMLDMPMTGLPEFYYLVGGTRDAFFTGTGDGLKLNMKTLDKFYEWMKNPVDRHGHSLAGVKKVRELLPSAEVAKINNGMLAFAEDVVGPRDLRNTFANGGTKVKNNSDTAKIVRAKQAGNEKI